jgi:hypothetical protein
MSFYVDVLIAEADAAVDSLPDHEPVATINGLDPVLGFEPLLDAIPGVPTDAKARELKHDLYEGESLWALPAEVAVGLAAADPVSLRAIARGWSDGTGIESEPLLGVLEEIADALRAFGSGRLLYLRLVL